MELEDAEKISLNGFSLKNPINVKCPVIIEETMRLILRIALSPISLPNTRTNDEKAKYERTAKPNHAG